MSSQNEIISAIMTIARNSLPDFVVTIENKKLKEEVVVEKGFVDNRAKSRYSVPRVHKNHFPIETIDRDINRIAIKGGRHAFITSMFLTEKSRQNFQSSICREAKKLVIGLNDKGTKRWRTSYDAKAQRIYLYVSKAK